MENKIIIICKSSTGFTKKYASLISRKTGARLVDFKEASPELMSGCDLVIFGMFQKHCPQIPAVCHRSHACCRQRHHK